MTDAITTTVTWADLKAAYDSELADVREGYEDLRAKAIDEYGEDALNRPAADDETLAIYQSQADQFDQTARTIQNRQHALDRLKDEFGDGAFELKMLSGSETMDIEAELRMEAQQRDVSPEIIQVKRNALTVDKATVDAPEGVPRDDEGSPVPSECPNALTLALWEQVERYNNSGATDFRAEGLGEASPARTPTAEPSATPTTSNEPSPSSEATDER